MTITTNLSAVTLDGNGATTSFPFDFRVPSTDELKVLITGSSGSPELTTNWTAVLSDSGGTVTYPAVGGTVLPSGAKISIMRDMAFTQGVDLVNATTFNSEVIEAALDNLTMQIQQVNEEVGRAFMVPVTSDTPPGEFMDYLDTAVEDASASAVEAAASAADAASSASGAAIQAGLASASAASLPNAASIGSGKVPQSTGTAWSGTYASASVMVKNYGALCDGATDDASAIQAAIDAMYALGGGVVEFPSGTCLVRSTIYLKSGVVLKGQGINATCIALAAGSNCDVIQSYNFANLTGTNAWLVTNGVPHGFGLRDLRISGNHQGGQTPLGGCYGVRFYGKRLDVQNVLIIDCEGIGYYSECSLAGGQYQWRDLPEGIVSNVTVRNCHGHGVYYNGPHDGRIEHIISCLNTGDGCRFESSSTTAAGADIGFIHSYANSGYGLYLVSATIRLAHAVLESNGYAGLYLDSGSSKSQFAILQLFLNCAVSGSYQMEVHGNSNTFTNVRIEDRAIMKGGIKVNAVKNIFGEVHLQGGFTGPVYSTGTGIEITNLGGHTQIRFYVENFAGTGGQGLVTGSGGASSYCFITGTVNNCATCWNNATMGSRNDYNLRLYANTGQTAFTGYGPQTADVDERWNVQGRDGTGTAMYSEVRKLYSTSTVNLNITTEQTFSIPHGLFATPEIEDCEVRLNYTGTNTVWEQQYCRITSVDATNINVSVKLSTAAGTALTCGFVVLAKL